MRRHETLPGQTLCEIAELLFGADPHGQGLLALIADAQQEWTGTTSRVGRVRVRVGLCTAFWLSVLLYALDRATRPPNAAPPRASHCRWSSSASAREGCISG